MGKMILFYLLIAVAITRPIFLNLDKTVFGYSGDNFGIIWNFWWQRTSLKQNLTPSHTELINAPVGLTMTSLPGEILWSVPMKYLSLVFSEVVVFNLAIILSFFLSGITMFLLLQHLYKNYWVSIFGGLIYTVSPYHVWQSYTHLSLALVQWLPLFVLSLIYFDEHKNLKSAVFMAVSYLLVALTSLYYAFFSLLVLVTFFAYKFLFDIRGYLRPNVFLNGLAFSIFVLVAMAPMINGLRREKVEPATNRALNEIYHRQLDELVGLSARPWDYLIYPPSHSFFGRYNKPIYDFISSQGSDFKVRSAYLPERVVFLGLINFILFVLGSVIILKKNRGLAVLIFLFLFTFIVSMPPYFIFKGVTFYTPSFFLFKVVPLVRVYSRMGIFVLLFSILISSSYLNDSLKKLKSQVAKGVFLFILLLGLSFEYLPGAAATTTLEPTAAVYDWLSQQPGNFIVVEYPEAFDLQSGLIFQRVHGKKLFNMPSSEPRIKLWDSLRDLRSSQAYLVLKQDGVRYLIYHLVDLTPNPYDDWRFFRVAKRPTELEEAQIEAAGFKKIRDFPEAIVYEVT